MKLKMLGLLSALVIAAPVAAVAAPAGGLTANMVAPATVASSGETNAAATPGTTAKIDKVWWRGGYGYRGGYGFSGGYGFRRFGFGYGAPLFRGYYGYRRPFLHRRFY